MPITDIYDVVMISEAIRGHVYERAIIAALDLEPEDDYKDFIGVYINEYLPNVALDEIVVFTMKGDMYNLQPKKSLHLGDTGNIHKTKLSIHHG